MNELIPIRENDGRTTVLDHDLSNNALPPVYTIEGRAAVSAYDLYQIWSGTNDRYFVDWVKLRIRKYGWLLGKQYVSYKAAGKRLGYILSLDAAIEAARGEAKGRGKIILTHLTDVKRQLRKQRLSTRGKLSDFISVRESGATTNPLLAFYEHYRTIANPELLEPIRDPDQTVNQPAGEPPNPLPTSDLESRVDRLERVLRQLVSLGQQTAQQWSDLLTQLDDDPAANSAVAPASTDLDGSRANASELVPVPKVNEVIVDTQPVEVAESKPIKPDEPVPPTLREQIREQVNQYCLAMGKSHEEVYTHVYSRLNRVYGINASQFERQRNESILEACERMGCLEKLLAIVSSAEFDSSGITPKAVLRQAG